MLSVQYVCVEHGTPLLETATQSAADAHVASAAPTSSRSDVATQSGDEPAAVSVEGLLSRRETQVLELVAAGTTTGQIAEEMRISVHTVRNHVRNLRRKLDARTKLEAVATAFRRGLL